MEGGGHQAALPYGDDPTGPVTARNAAEDGDTRPDLLHPGGPDEQRVEGAALQAVDGNGRLERRTLAAEGVAAHRHVDPADGPLPVGTSQDTVGEHDHPGAGSVGGHPGADALPQRLQQALPDGNPGHGGGLAAGDHEGVDRVEVPGGHHLGGAHFQLLQDAHVLGDVALQGQYADGGSGHPHLARVGP